ncbi:hypothetical protein SAMN02745121_03898 [Nannocystis exedens]|uniref:Uncharacterized protein n=1 Tax=Nannocystis exedens TaxID=54 RepID=A0A1I1ZQ29_9BACT|nr:hypothetical protein [Nannocystis exedens]PCC75375.1 hypothetical protein NAEX_08485 [Nannocystis exedens]SFE33775.1 hypothetical protein SAMN02745121_03898 [Nannocystis exedens]
MAAQALPPMRAALPPRSRPSNPGTSGPSTTTADLRKIGGDRAGLAMSRATRASTS